jgi:hypothetical protein
MRARATVVKQTCNFVRGLGCERVNCRVYANTEVDVRYEIEVDRFAVHPRPRERPRNLQSPNVRTTQRRSIGFFCKVASHVDQKFQNTRDRIHRKTTTPLVPRNKGKATSSPAEFPCRRQHLEFLKFTTGSHPQKWVRPYCTAPEHVPPAPPHHRRQRSRNLSA